MKLANLKVENWEEHVNFLWGNFKIRDCQRLRYISPM